MKTAYFKNYAFRFDTIPSKAVYVILFIPSLVFSSYGLNCRYKYSLQIAWLNWTVAFLWKEQSGRIWECG